MIVDGAICNNGDADGLLSRGNVNKVFILIHKTIKLIALKDCIKSLSNFAA